MFAFHWGELLVVVISGLILFFGLALLMLRRRFEILQMFLTPEDPDIEKEFFRLHTPVREETVPENEAETESETLDTPEEDTVRWGTAEQTP